MSTAPTRRKPAPKPVRIAETPEGPPELPNIDPDLRRRLEADILSRGILVPVMQTEDGVVLDGRLRIAIAEEHGLDCPRIIVGRLSPDERADLRIVLNLLRRQLTQAQVRVLIAWELRLRPQDSDRSVARRIGVDNKTVAGVRKRMVAVEEIPHLDNRNGSDGKRYPSARKPVVYTSTNAEVREASHLLSDLGEDAPEKSINIKKLRRLKSAKERAELLSRVAKKKPSSTPDYMVHHCDFRSLDKHVEPGTVDLVLTDPPWGGQFAPHRRAFAGAIERLLKPDGIAAIYTGVAHMPEFIDELRAVGLKYLWTIVASRKVSTVNQKHRLINRWVPIVLIGKGGLQTSTVLNDVLDPLGKEKEHHPWQQPIEEAAEIIRALCPPGGLICDPCTGSGSTAVATIRVGEGRRFIGCESDGGTVKIARARIAEAMAGRELESR